MAADPSVAPKDTISNLEGTRSTSPAQGLGLHHQTLDPSLNVIRKGRIEDLQMDKNCAIVAVIGYKRNIPCLWLADVFNRLFGAKRSSPPSIGTEVAVAISNDQKFGVIIGCLNSSAEKADKPAVSLFGTSVDRNGDLQAHKSKDWGWGSAMIDASDGIHLDILPGDDVTVNAQGALSAIMELVAIVRGGNAASIEAFVLDQLLRITGFNLQVRTALYERNILEDGGMITEETAGSHVLYESLGNEPEPQPDSEDKGTDEKDLSIARRFQDFRGFLSGLKQNFIMRPSSNPADMTKAETDHDLGLYQHFEHLSGFVLDRSVTGGGMIKGVAIPVPKKKKAADDPEGDTGAPKNKEIKGFTFSEDPGTPAGNSCQLRDYLAYHFNKVAPARFEERNKDWSMPDEADCPTVGKPKVPGVGGFYREFPGEVDAMTSSDGGEISGDRTSSIGSRQGTAWCLVLPDGSVSIRDLWGSQINMSGGHIDLSASKDVRIISGGSVVVLGGDDCIIKGRQSVDITASQKHIRLRAQQELFIHAEEGGMLIDLGTIGHKFDKKKKGEEALLSGITIKVPDDGGVTINAGQLSLNLSGALFFNSSEKDGTYPRITGKISGMYLKFEDEGSVAYDFKNGALGISNDGYLFTSGDILTEKNLYVKENGFFGGNVLDGADFNDMKSVKEIVDPVFEKIDDFQWQYELDELKDVYFTFRKTNEYAASDGVWFESFWQREMIQDTTVWSENSDKDGEFPYPGKDNYQGACFWTYSEKNVDESGRSKKRAELSEAPDGFKKTSFSNFPVHQDR